MTLAGYTHVAQVLSPGEYSVRGGLMIANGARYRSPDLLITNRIDRTTDISAHDPVKKSIAAGAEFR